MENRDLIVALTTLAQDAGLEVRFVGHQGLSDVDVPTSSGTCLVRGNVWVVLSASDPLEIQLEVLTRAVRTHASDLIEQRYIPPAVREHLSD